MADTRFGIPKYLSEGSDTSRPVISSEIANLPETRDPTPTLGGASPNPSVPAVAAPSVRPAEVPAQPHLSRQEYADMPMSEVLSRSASNFLPSAGRALKGTWDAVKNYEDTASVLGQVGKGLASKASGWIGNDQNPEEKARTEAVVDAIGQMYADRYGTMGGFKEALAEDPASIGLDVASIAPVIGGAGRLAGLGPVARGLERVASLGDPINLAAQGTKLAAKTVMKPASAVARYSQGVASGVPQSVLRIADEVGRVGTPAQRDAFKTFAMGKGDHRDIAKAAMDAVEELRQRASAEYTAGKQSLIRDELPMQGIRDAVAKLKQDLDPHSLGLFPELRGAINEIENQIRAVETSPYAEARSAVGLDRLKRSLNDVVGNFRGTQHVGALAEVPRAVRDTIARADTNYADMMDRWQKWRDELLDFQRTLGTSDRAAESARLAKLLSTAKKEDRMSLLKQLATRTQSGQLLPYMIAGATAENVLPPYLQGFGLGALGTVAAGGLHGVGAAALGSPRLAGLSSYGMGRLQGAVNALPTPPSVVSNALNQIGQDEYGYRTERKSGGRVGINHDRLADQLVTAAERAKKGISKSTEPLLNMPDDHIAHALEVANRSI